MQRLRRYTNVGNAITADNLTVSLKVKINARIIELLRKETGADAIREQVEAGV